MIQHQTYFFQPVSRKKERCCYAVHPPLKTIKNSFKIRVYQLQVIHSGPLSMHFGERKRAFFIPLISDLTHSFAGIVCFKDPRKRISLQCSTIYLTIHPSTRLLLIYFYVSRRIRMLICKLNSRNGVRTLYGKFV